MDEHLRKKRWVRDKDVQYMTAEWKRAIKNKREPENWEKPFLGKKRKDETNG